MERIRSLVSSVKESLLEIPVKAGTTVEHILEMSRKVAYQAVVASLVSWLLLSASAFMYFTFYFAFVPAPAHSGPIHPVFKPCEETAGRCGFLNATVPFSQLVSPGGGGPVLMTGQPYSVSVTLEMPESPANRGAGMFLTCLQMKSGSGAVAREECRAAMLQYRSELLRVIETFAFVPALITGYTSEKQRLHVEYFSDFLDDPLSPVTDIDFQLLSRFVEVYSVEYRVHARFTGLRFLMHHYPVISALVGCTLNLMFLSAVVLLSYFRFFAPVSEEKVEDKDKDFGDEDDGSEVDFEEEEEDDIDREKKKAAQQHHRDSGSDGSGPNSTEGDREEEEFEVAREEEEEEALLRRED